MKMTKKEILDMIEHEGIVSAKGVRYWTEMDDDTSYYRSLDVLDALADIYAKAIGENTQDVKNAWMERAITEEQ